MNDLEVSDDALARLEQGELLRAAARDLARDVSLDDVDLVADVRSALAREQLPGRPHARPRLLRIVAAPALLAAAAVIVVVLARGESADEAFRVKGAPLDATSFAGVRALKESQPGGPLSPVNGTMRASDGLAFTVSNGGPSPFSHLMIFAVTPGGDVHWYWPAFVDPATDPKAIPIGAGGVDLREVVRHDLRPGSLTVYLLFLRAPLAVSDVERTAPSFAALGAAGAHWQTMALEVVP